MKRFAKFQAIFLTITILLSTIMPLTLGVSAVENEVKVVLDGEALTFDVPGRLIGDRTMVPLFAIGAGASTLNGKVTDNTQISSFIAKAFDSKKSAQKLSPAA